MATNKIAYNSPSHANPSELEQQIAQAFYDLENSVSDLKASLRPLQFSSAKEVGYTSPLPRSIREASTQKAERRTQSPLLVHVAGLRA